MMSDDTKPWVLLDGSWVDPAVIDPAKHQFLGMFRPAINPLANKGDIICFCGQILRVHGQEIEHYRNGCCDSPQYVSLRPPLKDGI